MFVTDCTCGSRVLYASPAAESLDFRTAALSAFATRPSRGSIISGGWCAPLGLGRALEVARELQDASQGLVYCVVPEERLREETARAEAGRR